MAGHLRILSAFSPVRIFFKCLRIDKGRQWGPSLLLALQRGGIVNKFARGTIRKSNKFLRSGDAFGFTVAKSSLCLTLPLC